ELAAALVLLLSKSHEAWMILDHLVAGLLARLQGAIGRASALGLRPVLILSVIVQRRDVQTLSQKLEHDVEVTHADGPRVNALVERDRVHGPHSTETRVPAHEPLRRADAVAIVALAHPDADHVR